MGGTLFVLVAYFNSTEPSEPGSSFEMSRPKTFGGGHTTRSAKRRVDRHRWQMR
jgi:hypothetical protein